MSHHPDEGPHGGHHSGGYHSGGNHDPYGQEAHGPPARRGPAPAAGRGGVPDGVLVGVLGLATALTVLVWSATGIAGWIAHGAWPEGVTFIGTATALRSFLTAPSDIPAAWPAADPAGLPGAALLWLVFAALLIVLFSGFLWGAIRYGRWRGRRRHGPGRPAGVSGPRKGGAVAEPFPPAPVRTEPTAHAADPDRHEPIDRPGRPETGLPGGPVPAPGSSSPPPPPPGDAVGTVASAPGPLVVTDPDGTLYDRTARRRSRSGPVHVYDPEHRVDAPVRLRWGPERGCADPVTARRRARALLAPVRPAEPVFALDAETAETLLRCFLHAAALDGTDCRRVQRWARSGGGEAARILRSHPRAAPGTSMELESALGSHPGRRDAGLTLVVRALEALERVNVRHSCSPGRADTIALENITGEGATLYVIGDDPVTAPLRGALLDSLDTLPRLP
ncbi:type VI secretion protein [Streptomyces sp. ST2-7A]|uniref:type VI secretion protein n=1 Tax=Streptomyces sp. ST2-7A TaxID=2907214 RepID=UPI001F226052|nr:type VI secretion protein [Streptomyces sp. ST2-7A]MCE7083362.1 type VI secretion protein [Streptomyces sp. ST2-7A]